jgi:pimeloyl-ACP methyl ester carboxylesterase
MIDFISTPLRSIRLALSLVVIAGAGCTSSAPPPSDSDVAPASGAAPTQPEVRTDLTTRAPDAFYDPPAEVPRRPGALLRSEPLEDVTLPAGMRGWRVLYTTSVDDRTPATAVATVFAPVDLPAGPRPVITWEHGTMGVMQKCMPSLVSAPTEGIPARDGIVAEGWVVVATDYSFAEKGGPHPYSIGEGEARAALDAVRAARQMPELTLDARTVVWGHSQGGHAALWTGTIGPRYAPDVQIVGIAAIAPAADIGSILAMNVAADRRLGPYLALAYSRFYPDVTFEQALRPEALPAAREIVNLCGFLPPEDPQRIAALTATFEGPALATSTNTALAARLEQNTADEAIAAPVVIAQGAADVVVPPAATDAYVDERCAAGQRLEYWTFAGRDHGTIVRPGTSLEAPLIAWTAARFANEPQPKGCARRSY